jgi:hypothetical protein
MRIARAVLLLMALFVLSLGTALAEEMAPAMASKAVPANGLSVLGIPALEWKTSCMASQYCSNWYFIISCSGTTSCSATATSITCDGTTTNCPAGTCAPIAPSCIGNEASWCSCVDANGNTIKARRDCTNALCPP